MVKFLNGPKGVSKVLTVLMIALAILHRFMPGQALLGLMAPVMILLVEPSIRLGAIYPTGKRLAYTSLLVGAVGFYVALGFATLLIDPLFWWPINQVVAVVGLAIMWVNED